MVNPKSLSEMIQRSMRVQIQTAVRDALQTLLDEAEASLRNLAAPERAPRQLRQTRPPVVRRRRRRRVEVTVPPSPGRVAAHRPTNVSPAKLAALSKARLALAAKRRAQANTSP